MCYFFIQISSNVLMRKSSANIDIDNESTTSQTLSDLPAREKQYEEDIFSQRFSLSAQFTPPHPLLNISTCV